MTKKNFEKNQQLLGIMLDENVTQEEYICTVETKLVKHFAFLFHAKDLLQEIYVLHTLIYTNIEWTSSYRFKRKTNHFHQKHAVHTVFNADKVTPLLSLCNRTIHEVLIK